MCSSDFIPTTAVQPSTRRIFQDAFVLSCTASFISVWLGVIPLHFLVWLSNGHPFFLHAALAALATLAFHNFVQTFASSQDTAPQRTQFHSLRVIIKRAIAPELTSIPKPQAPQWSRTSRFSISLLYICGKRHGKKPDCETLFLACPECKINRRVADWRYTGGKQSLTRGRHLLTGAAEPASIVLGNEYESKEAMLGYKYNMCFCLSIFHHVHDNACLVSCTVTSFSSYFVLLSCLYSLPIFVHLSNNLCAKPFTQGHCPYYHSPRFFGWQRPGSYALVVARRHHEYDQDPKSEEIKNNQLRRASIRTAVR